MNLKFILISYLNSFIFIFCLEVQLNVHQENDTIINYTIINNTYSKNELFNAEKIFFSKCECNYNTEVFYISPGKNVINFTINTTEKLSNNENNMPIESPNLFVNSKKIYTEYTLYNIDDQIYNLQINAMCKNPYNNINDEKPLREKQIKNYGIYKIEEYSETNHPDYNDNDNFAVLNFTFNYNKTLYHFSFIKICLFDEAWKNILSCCCIMLIAFIYIYLSTYMKLNFKFVKEVQQASDIKWYHIFYAVIFGSFILESIYLFRKYIIIILNILIGFESWLCVHYATLFFILQIGKKIFSNLKHKELNHKKCVILFDMTPYEIISAIISGIIIMFYFITRSWLLNDLICFCLAFTTLSFIILKSFMLCFICLFLFFLYDTFWVFYSEKIFKENVMVVAATSIQIPIKIEFPILFSNNPIKNCMLLGLGDILLPGVVIKYCRRFDLIRQKMEMKFKGMTFYKYNLLLYFISVSLAMIMMFVFNHGQPVLFYISPIFIIGLMVKAYREKCLSGFWNGLKIRKNKNINNNNKNEIIKNNEQNNEDENDEEEDEEDDEDKLVDNNNKKFASKKLQQTELQHLNLNN